MPQHRGRTGRFWREWRGFVAFIAVMLVFRSAVADWNQVPSGSMIPSILEGDRIVVDKLAYDLRVPFTFIRLARWSNPQRSDVITFESPTDGKLLVKRVIGIPGDTVALLDNQLYINDEAASYSTVSREELPTGLMPVTPYQEIAREELLGESRTVLLHTRRTADQERSFEPVVVPEGYYLVLGDNRDNSADSRAIGFVSRELVLGKANTIAFSLDYENFYAPRSDRFLKPLL